MDEEPTNAARLSEKDSADMLMKMYIEQQVWARHDETMRGQATNLIVLLSGAVLGFLNFQNLQVGDKGYALLFVVVINLFGCALSYKHYERGRRHGRTSNIARMKLSSYKFAQGSDLDEIYKTASSEHRSRFGLIRKIQLYKLWISIHVLLASGSFALWIWLK